MHQIAAISQQESETDKSGHPVGWKSSNMHAVVAATEDLFQFILSDKGSRVRVFLVKDIIKAADVFLQGEVFGCLSDDKPQSKEQLSSRVCLDLIS